MFKVVNWKTGATHKEFKTERGAKIVATKLNKWIYGNEYKNLSAPAWEVVKVV